MKGPGRAACLAGLLALAPGAARASGEGEAAAEGHQAELRADRVELVDGVVRGEGQVQARFGGDTATAARFELDRQRQVLTLWEGTWTRAAGTARFARAEIDLDAGGGEVLDAVLEGAGAPGRLSLRGEALSWAPDGTLSGRGLRLTTCGCETPPWQVQARQVTVDDRAAAFRGGLLRLCGLPVLPLPAGRVPLADRASGLLPPELGWGRDGLELGLPVYLVLDEGADVTLTPELRTERGARLLGEGRWAHPGGRGELRLAGGWDGVEDAARGAGQLDQAWADQGARLAVLGRVEGDRDYLSDYGDAFLSRGLPWAETQAVAAWRGLRLEHDGLQALGDTVDQRQRLVGAVARLSGRRLGPLSVQAGARVDAVGEGPAAWQSEEVAGRVEGDLGATAGRQLGILRLEGQARARALSWTDGQPWAEGGAAATAWLPGWADLGGGRLVGEVGLRAGGAGVLGSVDARLVEDEAAPAWQVGPVAQGRLLTAGGVPVSAGGLLALRPDGLVPTAWLRADRGPWALVGTVDGGLRDVGMSYDDGVVGLRFQVQHQGALLQARPEVGWRLPGLLSEWRPAYIAHLDLTGGLPLAHGPSLAFASRCGCLDAGLAATWSVDRDVPAVGFRLEVR